MNLQKLKNASLHELRVRAAQRVAAFSERRGWSDLAKLPSDQAFVSLLVPPNGRATFDLLEYFRSRSEPAFFAGFNAPEKTSAEFKSRWPETAQRIFEKADRICSGSFDLLGFKNLNFGNPIDWQFEPLTGKRIPLVHWSKLDYLNAEVAGDKKIIWELNRHQYFMTLGQAYWLTGDERYARVFGNHLESWMDANPPKLGINWASSLEVAFRSISWLWAFYYFKTSPSLSTKTFQRAWKFLYLNARHLESYLSTYFSPNTHLTGEALGLFYLGTLLPEFKEAKRWQELGSRTLIEQLPVHVKPDGVYFEQSTYYHRYTTDFYLHFLLLSRANQLTAPPRVEDALAGLLDHLMYITRPDGTTPFFGDDDGGRLSMLDDRAANDFRGTLGAGSVLLGRGDYKFVAGDAAEDLLWLTGVDGLSKFDSLVATQPAKTSAPFFDGGYFVMRDGWTNDSNYLLFDCGPHGALNCGHAHADALSFDLAANGRTILIDPGTYTYTGSKDLRDWFRSSFAHNNVTLDDHHASQPGGTFTWKTRARCSLRKWISDDRFDFVSGEHDGYGADAQHSSATLERSVFFLKDSYWIVREGMIALEDHRAYVQFHFDSSARPVLNSSVRDAESGFTIKCFGNGHWLEEDNWVSHCYGQKEASKTYRFSAHLKDGEDIFTFLLPGNHETEWEVTQVPAQDGHAFAVSGGKSLDLVIIRSGSRVETLGFTSEFDWLVIRFAGDQINRLLEVVAMTENASKEVSIPPDEVERLYASARASFETLN